MFRKFKLDRMAQAMLLATLVVPSYAAAKNTSSSSSGSGSSASSKATDDNSSKSSNAGGNGNGNGGSSGSSGTGNSGSSSGGSAGSSGPTSGGTSSAWTGTSSDLTYAYDAMVNAAAANDYYGLVSGNDNKVVDALGLSWGNGWTLVAKDDTGGSDDMRGTWQGMSFTVDAGAKSPSGSWSLTGSGGSLASGPVQLDLVAVVKSSTDNALYYFHDVLFDGSAMGSWLSPVFNDKGVRQDLSHLSVYLRLGDPYSAPDDGTSLGSGGISTPSSGDMSWESGGISAPSGGDLSMPSGGDLSDGSGGAAGPILNAVPEPGSLALVGVALAGLGATRRRSQARRG